MRDDSLIINNFRSILNIACGKKIQPHRCPKVGKGLLIVLKVLADDIESILNTRVYN